VSLESFREDEWCVRKATKNSRFTRVTIQEDESGVGKDGGLEPVIDEVFVTVVHEDRFSVKDGSIGARMKIAESFEFDVFVKNAFSFE
jgi:hypothetical protein